ncbi:MAG: GTP-binding protein [Burkholderiales bacterium]
MAGTTLRDPFAGRIPVTIITGFLGSGKTTLLNHLLAQPELARTAVIVNEYGEEGLDHDLLRFAQEKVLLLENGCVCCALRGDLQQTLRDLFLARRQGEIGSFERVFLETTGLADPGPLLQTLLTDTLLLGQFRLNGVVTCVDAYHALAQFDAHPEALKQAALADRLVITKSDHVDAVMLASVKHKLASLAPLAQVGLARQGEIEPTFVTDIGLQEAHADTARIDRWMGGTPSTGSADHRHHDTAITTFMLRFEQPFSARAFEQCIAVLTSLRGPDLLRVKGLINIEGEAGPLVVQGVQHLFHPPVPLANWPDAGRASRLIFITRGISRDIVAGLFAAVIAAAPVHS